MVTRCASMMTVISISSQSFGWCEGDCRRRLTPTSSALGRLSHFREDARAIDRRSDDFHVAIHRELALWRRAVFGIIAARVNVHPGFPLATDLHFIGDNDNVIHSGVHFNFLSKFDS